MRKRFYLLLLIVLCILTITGCKKDDKEEKKEEVVEPRTAIVISDWSERIFQLDDNFDKEWGYKVKDVQNYYSIVRVDGNYIYYVDGDELYKRDIKSNKEEDLGINMKDYWTFHVSGDDLVYSVLYDVYYVNLKDKSSTKLNIASNNTISLRNGVVYYTSKDNSLRSYNLSTKESNTIEKKGRILEDDRNSFLYVNDNNEYVVYNIKDDTSYVAFKGNEYALSSGENYSMHLYNDKVYTIKEDTLSIYKEDKEDKVYTYKLKDNAVIKDFIMLGSNKVLLMVYIPDPEDICDSEICDPYGYGDMKYILVDIKNKKEKEIKNNTDIFDENYEIQYIYE